MQEALPYKRWDPLTRSPLTPATHLLSSSLNGGANSSEEDQAKTVSEIITAIKENPVIVVGKRGCCMCHVVRKLLIGLGVNPPVFEISVDFNESLLVNSLLLNGGASKVDQVIQLPVVFVGGKIFGGLDTVMASHLSGELVPILKQARALWL